MTILRLLVVLCAVWAGPAFAAATIVILNSDGAGEGFNDPTAVAPIGGNLGTTLGQQRLNVFQAAANVWGANLNSTVTIVVQAFFNPQTCGATSGVTGTAGPVSVTANFPNAPTQNTWYHRPLADKLRNADGNPGQADINAIFNSNFGSNGTVAPATGCGFSFYLGLDNNGPASSTDLFTAVLHELAHGLGFSTATNVSTGAFAAGLPHIWDRFLLDTTQNALWADMTDAQRVASAINTRRLVWTGANANAAAQALLSVGTPELLVLAPGAVAGSYVVAEAAGGGGGFPLTARMGDLMPAIDSGGVSTLDACEPIVGTNAATIAGRVTIADRGTCTFLVKATNVQAAGAIGLILANNVAGSPPTAPGGVDSSITIPVGQVTQAAGAALRTQLQYRSRTRSGILVSFRASLAQRFGLDGLGRLLMYTPDPVQPGTSVSHFDPIAAPNLLMEPPPGTADVSHAVGPPFDLTIRLLIDIGW